MTDPSKIEDEAHKAFVSTEGWVKTHTTIAIALACFVFGALCGYLLHH